MLFQEILILNQIPLVYPTKTIGRIYCLCQEELLITLQRKHLDITYLKERGRDGFIVLNVE